MCSELNYLNDTVSEKPTVKEKRDANKLKWSMIDAYFLDE